MVGKILGKDEVGVKLLTAQIMPGCVLEIDGVASEKRDLPAAPFVQPRDPDVRLDRPSVVADIDDSLTIIASDRRVERERAGKMKLVKVPSEHTRQKDKVARPGQSRGLARDIDPERPCSQCLFGQRNIGIVPNPQRAPSTEKWVT